MALWIPCWRVELHIQRDCCCKLYTGKLWFIVKQLWAPSTHQQLRYHGDRILDSFRKIKSRTALLVIKILFHRHVFVEYSSLDFMIFTTPNRSNKKDYSFHYYHRDKLNEKLLTPLCYFNFRWDNRPFWGRDWGPHWSWMSSWWIPCNLQDGSAGLIVRRSKIDRQQWIHIQDQVWGVNVVDCQ